MGLFSDFKISTIYYYVQDTFKNDKGIINVFSLSDNYDKVSQELKCRVACYDELEIMAHNSLIFNKGLICVYEGYFIWDNINKIYFKIDVDFGMI